MLGTVQVGVRKQECMSLEVNASDVDSAQQKHSPVTSVTPVELGWRPLALIFFVALLLRAIVLFELSQTPFFSALIGDSMGYHVWAAEIANGDWLGSEVFYQAPLYPYLLGILYAVFGPDALWAKLAQIVLEAFTCALLAGAGARFFGSARVGILSGTIACLYAPAIFFTTIVQKATLGFFLTAVVLNLLSRLFQTIRSPRLLVLLGVSLGLLVLTRENALVFILVIVPWLAVNYRHVPWQTLTRWIALLLLGVSIPLASVGLRNYMVGGEFALTTSQFGTNFFIGNNANSKGFYLPLRLDRGNVEYERNDAVAMAESVAGRKLSPREVSEFWTAEALEYISTHPIDWLGLMARKTLLVWNRVEASDSEDITAYGHFSWLLGALSRVFHFGTMVPLTAAGIWLTRRRWRELGLLYLMLATYAASLTLFFLFARYRVPLIPLVLIFASAGAIELRALVGSRTRRDQFQTGLVIATAALLANLSLTDTRSQLAATYKNFGAAMIDAGKFPEAVEYLGKSLSYRPDVTVTLRGMAESLADLGRLPESRRYFERILQLDPDHFIAHIGLGRLDLMQGRSEDGVRMLKRATQLAPSDSQPYYFLGMHFVEKQDFRRAIPWLRGAANRETKTDMARLSLAMVLYRIGDVSGAGTETSRILQHDPNNIGAQRLSARIVARREQLEDDRPDL